MGDLPQWKTGNPPTPGAYIAWSESRAKEEGDEAPGLYVWMGDFWHHWTGWYDHAITHWMECDVPDEEGIRHVEKCRAQTGMKP